VRKHFPEKKDVFSSILVAYKRKNNQRNKQEKLFLPSIYFYIHGIYCGQYIIGPSHGSFSFSIEVLSMHEGDIKQGTVYWQTGSLQGQ